MGDYVDMIGDTSEVGSDLYLPLIEVIVQEYRQATIEARGGRFGV